MAGFAEGIGQPNLAATATDGTRAAKNGRGGDTERCSQGWPRQQHEAAMDGRDGDMKDEKK